VVEAKRTQTGVEEIVPAAPTVTVDVKVPPDVNDTSYPAGGVTKIPADIDAPETLNEVSDDAVPYVVDKADNVPVVEIVGVVPNVKEVKSRVATPVPDPIVQLEGFVTRDL
jgi:hypothetical protein